MIIVLKSVVNCESLGVIENFQGTCFGHAFSKTCQHLTFDQKMCKGFKYVSIKFIQVDL